MMKDRIELKKYYSTKEFLENYIYEENNLGVECTEEGTTFRLWSPQAECISLNLYQTGDGGNAYKQIPMKKEEKGVWSWESKEELHGVYYDYLITRNGEEVRSADPYAKACGVNGLRSMAVNLKKTNPKGWEKDQTPEEGPERIVYELHVKEFSWDKAGGFPEEYRGKYKAFTCRHTTLNEDGIHPTGLDYLKELGVTHIQIMPMYDYGSINEAGEDTEFNWGYDPVNYNVPEGSYATDARHGEVRIREMKEMIQAIHEAGFGVIMDVVYNHTYSLDSWFQRTVPWYFYRVFPDGKISDGSACGNDVASEREMCAKYILESVLYWTEEYHIDGFRFDLMGIHDIETMNRLREELLKIDPTIFIYGEGWAAADSPLPFEQRAVKENVGQMEGIAVFNDEFRDGLKGSTFDEQEPGYASGNINGHFEPVKYGIVGGTRHPQVDYDGLLYCDGPYAGAPSQMVNFVSCHDGYTLVDKLQLSVQGEHAEEELPAIDKLIHTVLLTSQGIPFIRSGEEIMQDKQGEPNSYKSSDSVNRIDWVLKAQNRDIFDYIRGLIALRKAHPAFRIPTVEGLEQWLHFLDTGDSGIIAYTLGEYANGDMWKEILVAYNGNRNEAGIHLPEQDWIVVCKDGQINLDSQEHLPGGDVSIAASSALILYRN